MGSAAATESKSETAGRTAGEGPLPAAGTVQYESLIPLIVGVTGHCDLREEDLGRLRNEVAAILRGLRAKYPSTPIVVLSPLAEGADRLVAQTALDLGREIGVELLTPLPLACEDYLSDFESDASKQEFRAMLGRSIGAFTVETPPKPGREGADAQQRRIDAYEAVGRYIASHAHVLLALWDGEPPAEPAGAGAIVHWRLTHTHHYGQPPLIPDPVASGPVCQIRTPRKKNPAIERPFAVEWRYPSCAEFDDEDEGGRIECDEHANREYENYPRMIDATNRFIAAKLPPLIRDGTYERNMGWLLPPEKAERLNARARRLLRAYAAADSLAMENQARTLRTHTVLCGLVCLAIVVFEAVSHILHPHHLPYSWVLVLFPLVLMWAMHVLRKAEREALQDRHQDFRAMAEGLRVQLFWCASGMPSSVAEHYLNHARELGWIRSALHAWACVGQPEADAEATPALAREHWIADQLKYFERTIPRERKQLHKFEKIKKWFYRGSLALGLIAAATITGGIVEGLGRVSGGEGAAHAGTDGEARSADAEAAAHGTGLLGSYGESLLLTAVGFLLLVSGMAHFHAEKRAFESHIRQYKPMLRLYREAQRRLDAIDRETELPAERRVRQTRALLRELGRDALAENAEWISAHRARPLEVPIHA
jgi:hypothetical protein